MIKSKKQMFTVIGAFVLVMMLMTVTYAFFNYTRTGVSNTIKTGRIYFNAEQGDTVTLSDLFPISLEASEEVSSETPGVGSLTIHVTGDTMYDDGIEYLVKAVDVTNTAGNSNLPISIAIKYEETNGKTIGMEDEEYFDNRGGNSSLYKVLSKNSITDDGDLVVGYIAKGQTGIDGTITIMAYLDAKNIAISDTYPEADVTHTETSGEASNETSVEVVDYSNGTTSEWVGDRTVFTTSEWNALQTSGISFKIKIEANEGIWVEDSNKPICKRVTNVAQLHTEECTNSSTSNYCKADGYVEGNLGTTITYGNAKALGSTLAAGDAFDCDVNGDGIYNERFYYVSPYYNTDTLTFDDENGYATLIYYSNTINGVASTSGSAYATKADIISAGYNVSWVDNWHGPVTAKVNLPTTQEWNNTELKTASRTILAEYRDIHNSLTTGSGENEIVNPFSYAGYSARLLTTQEVMNGCGLTQVGYYTTGELSNCKFLFEKTMYADSTKETFGIWFETPLAYGDSNNVMDVRTSNRTVNDNDADGTMYGVRPAIDVPYNKLAY